MLPIVGCGMDGYIELNPLELKGKRDAAIALAAAMAADEWEDTLADKDDPDVEDICCGEKHTMQLICLPELLC